MPRGPRGAISQPRDKSVHLFVSFQNNKSAVIKRSNFSGQLATQRSNRELNDAGLIPSTTASPPRLSCVTASTHLFVLLSVTFCFATLPGGKCYVHTKPSIAHIIVVAALYSLSRVSTVREM